MKKAYVALLLITVFGSGTAFANEKRDRIRTWAKGKSVSVNKSLAKANCR